MNLFERFYELLIAGGVGIFGGIASYIYRLTQSKEPFNGWLLLASIVIAFFVGNVAGSFVPKDLYYRDGLFMILGFLSYPILALLEKDGMSWLKSIVPGANKLGSSKEDNDNG
ncbi:hypothetical protein SHAb15599_00074 [Acinetobacter phage SH-Ab 15599]|nr:hypothetical protein SHAb15599_00074 [Acinetobacter phage SH-Ab 15599]